MKGGVCLVGYALNTKKLRPRDSSKSTSDGGDAGRFRKPSLSLSLSADRPPLANQQPNDNPEEADDGFKDKTHARCTNQQIVDALDGSSCAISAAVDATTNACSADVSAVALERIGVLASSDTNSGNLGKAGAGEAILSAMKAHASNVAVGEKGCIALHNLTNDVNNKAKLIALGSISVCQTILVNIDMPEAAKSKARDTLDRLVDESVSAAAGGAEQTRQGQISEPWCGGGLADILVDTAPLDGVQFQLWDPKIPVAQQPRFHVIVHKLTEDLSTEVVEESNEKIAALQAYLGAHPGTVIVDSLAAVRHVVSRALTCETLARIERRKGECERAIISSPPSSISASSFSFRLSQPRFFVFDTSNGDTRADILDHQSTQAEPQYAALSKKFVETMQRHGLTFPIICKSVQACGTPDSHKMVVIVSQEGLSHIFKREQHWLVQQYHNHDASFYKVYVIDADVLVFRRQSLPNLDYRDISSCTNDVHSLEFDSRFAYPTIEDFKTGVVAGDARGALMRESEDVKGSILEDLLQRLRVAAIEISEEFGLTLFGFDVIAPSDPDSDSASLLVVDVNYFPSYKEVCDFPQRFRRYLRRAGGFDVS